MQENTNARLRMLLAGGMLTEAEGKRFGAVFSGRRRFLPIFGFVLAAMLVTGYFPAIIFSQPTWYEKALVVGLLTAASVLTVVMFILLLRYPDKLRRQQWELYKADESPRRLHVYDDRVTEFTKRFSKTVFFKDVKIAAETADGFAISNGEACIILRAADMTAFDITAFRLMLEQNVSADRLVKRSVALAGRAVPLPIPHKDAVGGAEIIGKTECEYTETELYHSVFKKRLQLLVGMIAPAALLLALTIAAFLEEPLFSKFFLTQFLVVNTLCFLIAVLQLFFSGHLAEKNIAFLFTTDGIIISFMGNYQFLPKEAIVFKKVKQGVEIRYLEQPLFRMPEIAKQESVTLDKKNDSINE